MDRVIRFGLVALLGICAVAGCGKDSATDATATNSTGGTNVQKAADPATDPIARAASDFMDAVIKGDTHRAQSLLTPLSIQRINESGKEFNPPGFDKATFRIGEVRTPSETQAIVQYELTYSTSDGKIHTEELCSLMRLVDGQWRVSGIASSNGAGRPPVILDFENPPPPQQAPAMASAPGQPGAAVPTAGRPSPPRSVQQTPAASYR